MTYLEERELAFRALRDARTCVKFEADLSDKDRDFLNGAQIHA